MDIGRDVQKAVEKEGEEISAKQIVQLQADLREATMLLESIAFLQDNFQWGQFLRILIDPTKDKLKKTVDEFNEQIKNDARDGKENPGIVSQIIYHKAFLDVLSTLTDFKTLRKKYQNEIERLKGRLKTIEKQYAKE